MVINVSIFQVPAAHLHDAHLRYVRDAAIRHEPLHRQIRLHQAPQEVKLFTPERLGV